MIAQPEALRLADAIDRLGLGDDIAVELRRLHEVNSELVKALQAMLGCCYDMERNDETIAAVKLSMKAIYSATGDIP